MRTVAASLPLVGFFPHPPPQSESQSQSQSQSEAFFPTRNCPNKTSLSLSLSRLNYSNDPKDFVFSDDETETEMEMEGYLNQLSLEYDSVWDTKPSWCQPWTITLTGIFIVSASWLILRSLPVTFFISFLISAWCYIFLYSYPKAYSEMIAERRKRVTSGVEDTFGRKKKQ